MSCVEQVSCPNTIGGGTYNGAMTFEIITPGKTLIELQDIGLVKFRVNPSNAEIPTGAGADIAAWSLDHISDYVGTRASYVKPSADFSLLSINPDPDGGTGQYVAMIQCDNFNMNYVTVDRYHTLVLNTTPTETAEPINISSPMFVLAHDAGASANCIVMQPNSTTLITMSQVMAEAEAYGNEGVRSEPRIREEDVVTMNWVWSDVPGNTQDGSGANGALSFIEKIDNTEGRNARFRITAGRSEGNVIVAAKVKRDGDDEIVWAWHLWITKDNPTSRIFNIEYKSAGEPEANSPDAGRNMLIMDRNLGAMSNVSKSHAATGLLYQWGRKDPLPSKPVNTSLLATIYTPEHPDNGIEQTVFANSPTDFDFAFQNPGAFIYAQHNAPEYVSASASFWCEFKNKEWVSKLWYNKVSAPYGWRTFKSVYDPCPEGWRLPSYGAFAGWDFAGAWVQYAGGGGYAGIFTDNLGYMAGPGRLAPGPFYSTDHAFWYYTSNTSLPETCMLMKPDAVDPVANMTTINEFDTHGAEAFGVRCVSETYYTEPEEGAR